MDKHYTTVHYLYSFHRETTVIIDDVRSSSSLQTWDMCRDGG